MMGIKMMYLRRRGMTAPSMIALALAAGLWALPAARAFAADAAVSAADAPKEEQEVDAVVVTGKVSNPAVAASPARGVLNETEPEAVITRKFIEEAAPRVGDFSTIAALAPSMVATPQANGPGLSDGGKIALRGFGDGQFNITFDGIAWNDTNGPSHHGTAFFPNSTIGGVIIDRGPGRASDFGPANFGGSVNLQSLALENTPSFGQVITGGSFNTWQFVTTLQSGKVSQLHDARFLANFQELSSNGYLTNNYTHGNTQMFKGEVPITDKLNVTALYTHTYYLYNKSDIGDASVAQLEQFGRNFSLSNDPTLQNYFGWNWARKQTDFEYARINGEIGGGFSVDNTVYGFGYNNDTWSGQNNLAARTANVITPTFGPVYPIVVNPTTGAITAGTYASPPKATPAIPAVATVSGIPGYRKKNEYRTYGDIAKFSQELPFGTLSFGTNYERSSSYRYIIDMNMLTGLADWREKAATAAGPSAPYTQTPLYIQYIEFSGWKQYQPYVEFEWRPTPALTIRPGVKYVHWEMLLNAPVEKLANGAQPLKLDQTFTKTIPFFNVNYRITSDWSVYGEYAQGMLIPNIGNFYVNNLASTKVVPQESTNYQVGMVYQRSRFALDGDLYWIDFKHKIQQFTDVVTGQPYETNSGGATYKGIELQGTYAFPHGVSVFANYSYNSSVGTNDPSNPLYNNHQLTNVPQWTAAVGARLEHDHLFDADDAVIVALNDKFVGAQYTINAKCSSAPNGVCAANAVLSPVTGVIPSYSQADLSMTYHIRQYSIEAQVLNLLGGNSLVSIKGSALIPGTPNYALTSAQGGGANAPLYQVPRSYQITLKAKF
jgi:iron complex outermembrane receptor protein